MDTVARLKHGAKHIINGGNQESNFHNSGLMAFVTGLWPIG